MCASQVIAAVRRTTATVRATFQTGPIGTGSFLVGHARPWSDPQDVEVWLLLLFFPLIPLSRWRVTAAVRTETDAEGGTLDLTVLSRSRVEVRVTVIAFSPLTFGVWKAGLPWATRLLAILLGSVLSPGVLGLVGTAIELVVVLLGVAIPMLIAMILDEQTPRVPLRFSQGMSGG
jgi:hypothetical protein